MMFLQGPPSNTTINAKNKVQAYLQLQYLIKCSPNFLTRRIHSNTAVHIKSKQRFTLQLPGVIGINFSLQYPIHCPTHKWWE